MAGGGNCVRDDTVGRLVRVQHEIVRTGPDGEAHRPTQRCVVGPDGANQQLRLWTLQPMRVHVDVTFTCPSERVGPSGEGKWSHVAYLQSGTFWEEVTDKPHGERTFHLECVDHGPDPAEVVMQIAASTDTAKYKPVSHTVGLLANTAT